MCSHRLAIARLVRDYKEPLFSHSSQISRQNKQELWELIRQQAVGQGAVQYARKSWKEIRDCVWAPIRRDTMAKVNKARTVGEDTVMFTEIDRLVLEIIGTIGPDGSAGGLDESKGDGSSFMFNSSSRDNASSQHSGSDVNAGGGHGGHGRGGYRDEGSSAAADFTSSSFHGHVNGGGGIHGLDLLGQQHQNGGGGSSGSVDFSGAEDIKDQQLLGVGGTPLMTMSQMLELLRTDPPPLVNNSSAAATSGSTSNNQQNHLTMGIGGMGSSRSVNNGEWPSLLDDDDDNNDEQQSEEQQQLNGTETPPILAVQSHNNPLKRKAVDSLMGCHQQLAAPFQGNNNSSSDADLDRAIKQAKLQQIQLQNALLQEQVEEKRLQNQLLRMDVSARREKEKVAGNNASK